MKILFITDHSAPRGGAEMQTLALRKTLRERGHDSDSGGLKENVQHSQTGFLVPPGDPQLLADALLHVLQDRELAERLGRSGREIALAHFSEATFVEKMMQVYRSLIE